MSTRSIPAETFITDKKYNFTTLERNMDMEFITTIKEKQYYYTKERFFTNGKNQRGLIPK